MPHVCPGRADPAHTNWGYCPSEAAAILFTVLFALTTLAHLSQAIFHRKISYCWVIIGSGLIQTLNYVFRVISIKNPDSLGPYAAWFILILIAPLFTNAFIYIVMGRMVWNYVPDAKLYRVTAWWFSRIFVALDIISLIVQVAGAASVGTKSPGQQVENGIHIYMGGVGFQQLCILVFLFFAIKFHRMILQQIRQGGTEASRALPLLYASYSVLALISMRIIFRLVEYSNGINSSIPQHEVYQYCLDSLPMFIALIILNIVHPGRYMPGKDSELPSRKERRTKHISNKSEMVRKISGTSSSTV